MRKACNKLTIFGSTFKYSLANNLIKSNNKVKYFGNIYPNIINENNDLRTIGKYNSVLARKVFRERLDNRRIINIGSNHLIAIGAINGVLHYNPDTIVLCFTENIDTLSLAFLTGLENINKLSQSKYLKNRLEFDQVACIGTMNNSMNSYKTKMMIDNNIFNYSMNNINICTKYNDLDASTIMEYTINKLDPFKSKPIYVSFDMNVIKSVNGITKTNAFEMMDYLNLTNRVIGMDMVGLNNTSDHNNDNIKIAMNCIEHLFDNKT